MCGIAGRIGRAPLGQDRIEACLESMRRRGPDHRAHRRHSMPGGGAVDLLHSRLSIIDLDPRANQPFQDGARSLIYNGELYNFVELRASLEAEGVAFSTNSDTEVLLKAIDVWGWSALDRCEGMWAFALFDAASGTLTLARDRFGEKPLYVFRDSSGLYFGSEVKFIAAMRGATLEVDVDHIQRFLVNGYKSLYKQPRGFFKNLTEVRPATTLTIDASGAEREALYWTPSFSADDSMSYEEAVEGTRERLLRAVDIRLRADVPIAFCMSGGVDSNSLIAVAKNVFGYDVHGFTIVDSDGRYDEGAAVSRISQDLGIRHSSLRTSTANFLPGLRALVRQHDAPVYTISYYAHALLMEEVARAGYRISVSGTAADEFFTGYYDHHLAFLREIRHDAPRHELAAAAWSQHVRPVVRNPYLSNPRLFIDDPDFRGHIYLHADRFSSCLTTDWSEDFEERTFTADLLRNRMFNELFHEAVPVILHEDDLNAMYWSIENRSPFLDRNLFEFCCQIPTRHLIQDGRAKAVLRDAMKGIVPAYVLENRQKVGFNAALTSFLDVGSPETRQLLLDHDSPVFEWVRREAVADLLSKPVLANSESKFLFNFLASKMFLEEFAN